MAANHHKIILNAKKISVKFELATKTEKEMRNIAKENHVKNGTSESS